MSAAPEPVTSTVPRSPWYDEGVRVAGAVDAVASVLVTGRDGGAAAWVALAVAAVQAGRRRVAVADLVGDAPALSPHAGAGDNEGIAESFIYGVSLNKVARPLDDGGSLFVLPSGNEPVATAEIFRSERWRRLAGGFRESGALLVLAAQADTPGLDALAASVEGIVVVGDLGGALPEAPPPLAVVAGPNATRRGRAVRARTPAAGAIGAAADDGSAPAMRELQPTPATPAWRRRAIYALGALSAAVGLLYWLVPGRLAPGRRPTPAVAAPARTDGARRVAAARRDSARRDSARRDSAGARADTNVRLTVGNPADSALAAGYAVYVVGSNTAEGATVDPRVDLATIPVPALTPVLQDGAPWYRLLVGAYPTRARADSLLRELQRRGVLSEGSGSVVRAPYALLVGDRLPAVDAARRVQALAARGVPTYPRSRGDGTVGLYAGAFQTVDEAAYLAHAARAAGVPASLVYRTGSAP